MGCDIAALLHNKTADKVTTTDGTAKPDDDRIGTSRNSGRNSRPDSPGLYRNIAIPAIRGWRMIICAIDMTADRPQAAQTVAMPASDHSVTSRDVRERPRCGRSPQDGLRPCKTHRSRLAIIIPHDRDRRVFVPRSQSCGLSSEDPAAPSCKPAVGTISSMVRRLVWRSTLPRNQ